MTPADTGNRHLSATSIAGNFMVRTIEKVLILAAAMSYCCYAIAQDKPPSWEVGQLKCIDIFEPDSTEFKPKPMIEYYFYWLNGYISGLKGASVLDKRLKAMSQFDESEVRAAVITYCRKDPDMSLIQATTAIAELMINMMGPGKTINLNWH
jgi:hypothetical protein